MEKPDEQKLTGRNFRRNLLLLAALVCLVVWMISVGGYTQRRGNSREVADFEKVLHKKEKILKDEISKLESFKLKSDIFCRIFTYLHLILFYFNN